MSNTTTYRFTVTGMHYTSYSVHIDDTLEQMPGVHRSQTSVRAGRTVVDADTAVDPVALTDAVASLGYVARLDPH